MTRNRIPPLPLWALILLCLALLCACSSKKTNSAETPEAPLSIQERLAPNPPDIQSGTLRPRSPMRLPAKRARLQTGILGPKTTVAGGRITPSMTAPTQTARVLNFDHAPLTEVVDAVLGKELGLEYVVSPDAEGEVSLHIEGDYAPNELFALIAEALAVEGVDIVDQNGIYVIRPMAESSGLALASSDDGEGGTPEVVAYRLRYVDAEQAQKVVKSFLGKDRPIVAYPATNTLLFAERPLAAQRVIQLLRALDMNILGEVGFEIIPLAAVPPQEAVNRLREIISGVGQLKGSVVDASTVFVPLQQLPGVLVVSPDPEALKTVRQWLLALDIHTEAAGEQVLVYHLENGLAAKVAPILQELFSPAQATREKSLAASTAATPGDGIPVATAAVRNPDVSKLVADLSGRALIIADEENNAIVIRANAADLAKIREVVQALDIMPRAVLIKMVIAEVDLSDELQYGVEWFLRSKDIGFFGSAGFDSGTGFTRDFSIGDSASGLIPGGLSLFAGSTHSFEEFAALINLLDAKNKVHILSTPTLLAMDNAPASFTVGGREPTISRVSKDAATDSSIVNDIDYQDTGIILSVTPHINSSGLVRLEVDQRITNVNPQAIPGVDLNTPRFTERQLKTSLIAETGETMVIGGIIQQRTSNNRTGAPILSDIPIINFFASTKSKQRERTELLIAVTPYVVSHNSDPVTRELIERLEAMKRQVEEVGLKGEE